MQILQFLIKKAKKKYNILVLAAGNPGVEIIKPKLTEAERRAESDVSIITVDVPPVCQSVSVYLCLACALLHTESVQTVSCSPQQSAEKLQETSQVYSLS